VIHDGQPGAQKRPSVGANLSFFLTILYFFYRKTKKRIIINFNHFKPRLHVKSDDGFTEIILKQRNTKEKNQFFCEKKTRDFQYFVAFWRNNVRKSFIAVVLEPNDIVHGSYNIPCKFGSLSSAMWWSVK